MPFVKKDREPFSESVVASGRPVEQNLLSLPRKISPTSHDGKTERVFEVVFVVDSHFLALLR